MLKTFVEQADEATRLEPNQPWPDCQACLYWSANEIEELTGTCRRYAPDAANGWAVTARIGWCGEWAKFK
jgi:hypothetical protein